VRRHFLKKEVPDGQGGGELRPQNRNKGGVGSGDGEPQHNVQRVLRVDLYNNRKGRVLSMKEVKEFKKRLELSSIIGAFQGACSSGVVRLGNNLSIAIRPLVRRQICFGNMSDSVAPSGRVGWTYRSIILACSIRERLEKRR